MESDPSPMRTAKQIDIEVEYTSLFPSILDNEQCTLMVSTYQAGKVISIGGCDGKLQISYLDFPAAMGIAAHEECIAVGASRQIHFLYPAHHVLQNEWKDSSFDGAFVPRSSQYTGNIASHELAWGNDGLWIVNTLFSCLCTLHPEISFQPKWQPTFVQQLQANDCCHLNGLAMREGKPAYVTMLAPCSESAGWRSQKQDGGCVYDVVENAIVCSGLAMPHSPRWYADRLWVLHSGTGEFGYIEPNASRFVPVEFLPGFLRGLSFSGHYAFVGLSRGRETNLFGGLPITEKPEAMRCGVGIIDLVTGRTVAVLKFNRGVDEIFAVEVLRGFRNPLFSGSQSDGKDREIWLI